jgi:ankyrin repeat protein
VLLESGADVNSTDDEEWTPLHEASYSGHGSVVKVLLESGASVDVTNDEGETSLHVACTQGHGSVVKMLLESGADDSNTGDEGRTPLHEASYSGHGSVVKVLIESGAVVNVTDDKGTSPLHSACKLEDSPFRCIVPMLILAGADTHARDGEGRLPIDMIEDDRRRMVFAIFADAEDQAESQALKPVLK